MAEMTSVVPLRCFSGVLNVFETWSSLRNGGIWY